MSRAAQLDCQHLRSCALVLTLFLFQKGQGFFPPLPIAALLPRRWRWADSKESQLGCYGVTWLVLQQKNRLVFFTTVGTMPTQSASLGMLRRGLDIPVTQKASGILYPRWSLLRAMRPVAEWRPFLFNKQGNHTRPASREARRRAAVKPRPNRISLYAPARPWRAVRGCRGHPLLYGEGFVLAEEGGVFGEKGTDEGGKELVHLLGTAARVESRIK